MTGSPKTYIADHQSLQIVVVAEGEKENVQFIGGRFVTDDKETQEAIEACDLFRSSHIRLEAPADPRVALVAAHADAERAADVADKEAADVEASRLELDAKPKRLRAAAEAAKKAALAASKALSDFDAKAAPKEAEKKPAAV